jgi:pimeloyl-ACP methyl ester carboxylesterase
MGTESYRKEPVEFVGAGGEILFGMVFDPEERPAKSTGIVICVDGIKQRCGTGGINYFLAERLAGLGYPVLSFDPTGVGDSYGNLQRKSLQEHYLDIQEGCFIPDTVAATTFFREIRPLDQVCLLGLCGGAVTALATVPNVQGCHAVLLLGLPALLEKTGPSTPDAAENGLRPGDTERARQVIYARTQIRRLGFYLKVIRNPGYYVRKVSMLLNSYARWAIHRVGFRRRSLISADQLHDRMNPVVFAGLNRLVGTDIKVVMVFAELDHVTWEFESVYWVPYGAWRFKNTTNFVYEVVQQANHVFTTPESRAELCSILETHLTNQV